MNTTLPSLELSQEILRLYHLGHGHGKIAIILKLHYGAVKAVLRNAGVSRTKEETVLLRRKNGIVCKNVSGHKEDSGSNQGRGPYFRKF